jgi:glycosyltransferase involved in cell wall biosynthesis
VLPIQSERTRCLAILPARNEAATVGGVVRGVLAALGCDVVVINDASSDETAQEAKSAGAKVLNLPVRLGAWGAAQAGLRYAVRNDYGVAITLDADGQHHPQRLPALLAAHWQARANVTIGSCPQRLSTAKRLAWAYFRTLTGLGVTDFTSGLRVYGESAIRILASGEASLLDYQDIGVLMLLRQKGLSIHETLTEMSPRHTGASRVFSSWFTVARYMVATTVLCVAQVGTGPATVTESTTES